MEQKELTALLQHPGGITPAQTSELKELLERYPYFQAARAVRLKGLRNENSLHYNKELKLTAAYTTDRGVLFDLITSAEFEQDQIADQIKKQEQSQQEVPVKPEEPKKEDPAALDQALKKKLREEEPQRHQPSARTEISKGEKEREQETRPDVLQLGKPLIFNKEENHSFSEWLKLTTAKPVKREAQEPEIESNRSRKFELIDEFISKSPKINPAVPANKANLAEERLVSQEALMTETLARVYLEQKNYKKAIQAYKILILKNPEKSGFFADQIRAIKKLQENNSAQE